MKKRIIIISILTILTILTVSLIFIKSFKKEEIEPFYLKDKYYEKSESIKINVKELDDLIKEKETFVLYVYHASYATSSKFNQILKNFQDENNLTIYKISYQAIQKSNYRKTIKSYPSFLIIKNGLIIDYLDSNNDKDSEHFKNEENFKTWFTKYIKLKKINREENKNNIDEKNQEANIKEKIELNYITRDENKINVYLFWGDGCPHCETIKTFLSNLSEEEKNLFNLYEFEIWKNKENKEIFNRFKKELNVDRTAVPFIVVGANYYIGSGSETKTNFIEAIKNEETKKFDIYFDKIKEN